VNSTTGKLLEPGKHLLRGQAATASNLQATTSDNGLAVSSAQLLRGTRSDVSYSVAVEFRLATLPKQGHRAALLRFAPPPTTPGRHTKRQEATLYVDENGRLTGNATVSVQEHEQTMSVPEKQKQKQKQKQANGPVVAGRWQVLVAAVDCLRGGTDCLSIYVDGTLTNHGLTDSDLPGDNALSLGTRIVLLGGGKQSESRGGDLRKVCDQR
jgi:hypothetical protein